MARRVFFSFDYDHDIRRVVQVRNSWRIRPGDEPLPFLDKAKWESLRCTGNQAIKNWIDRQLDGSSVTVVLIGAQTYNSDWVRYEIKQSYELKKGIVGVYIHKVRDPQFGTDAKGKNPLDYWTIQENWKNIPLSSLYKTYDWVNDDGYNNLSSWIEAAAKAAGR